MKAMERRITVKVSTDKPLSEQVKAVSLYLEEMSDELDLPEDVIMQLSEQRVFQGKNVRALTYRILWGFRGTPVDHADGKKDSPKKAANA